VKELYVMLAEYNTHANNVLFGVLEKAPPELLTRDARSYFGSILGILNHVLRSDLGYMNRFRASPYGFVSLSAPAAQFDPATAPKQLYDSFAGLRERRQQVDSVFGAFAAELTEDVLTRELRYANPRGEQESFVIAEVLLHLFNHETHHRGQVSQILDAAGIEHDFSNITTVLRARRAKR
jgi:uncharacterized damage-inducible protein DinB